MISDRFREYIFHPAFISFPLWIIVILLLPPVFSKYSIRHLRDITTGLESLLFSDLDSDGNSEVISVDLNDKERTKIIIYKNNRVVEQYNIKYQPNNLTSIMFDDYNNDNYLEIYIFTISEDSIFLSIIEPFKSRKLILSERFIDTWGKASATENKPFIKTLTLLKIEESCSDLFFLIQSGFTLRPRKLYRYIINQDSLLCSPEAGFIIQDFLTYDLNNDSLPEFLLSIQATGNYDIDYPFTDRYSWLAILDHQLKYLFQPVRLHPYPANLYCVPLKHNGVTQLAVFSGYFGAEALSSSFFLYDIKGNKINEVPAGNHDPKNAIIFSGEHNSNQTFFFLRNLDGDILELNSDFNAVKKLAVPALFRSNPVGKIDADGDGRKEYLLDGGNKIIFTRDDFSDPVSWTVKNKIYESELLVSQYLEKGKKPALYVQLSEDGNFIRYQKNLLYYFKYPFYLAIYGLILAFLLLLSHFQSYRLRQKQETEKRIASLQMKALKNQIDPHFTLNILNSIGALYSTAKNKQKADYIFGKYARLIRQTVISSDNIIVPMADEIDFIRNYLDIERFRSESSFDYSVEIENGIDMQARIPRTLIHTFVENAVKYGVRQRDKNGMIRIRIRNQNGSYEIIIEDNGPGISKNEHQGTGKGLRILDKLVDLYFKLEKSRIIYSLENISENNKTVSGTRAIIKILKQKG